MIVFKSDWARYPNAIPDTKTPNQSFLRMARVFKEMGVKHYYFHLALLQPELQGVDPHDEENLTLEQKSMILFEIDNNPWYFLREIVLIKGAGPTIDDCRYKANRANIAAMWLMLACIDYIQIQPRQTGKSFGSDCQMLWLMYFCYRNTSFNLITKDEDLRKSNIARLKNIRDEWPDYINRNTKKDDNNQISLSCKSLNNKYYTAVSQSSAKAANNLGRGMTTPVLQVDEGPFINHIETTISAAMGATSAARDIAKRNRKPYCTIFTTTAGNREDRDGKFMYEMWSTATPWDERLYDAENEESLHAIIRSNGSSRALTVNLTMSHRQLGLSDEWLMERIANARSVGDNVDRDYLNIWTSSNSNTLLTRDLAMRVRASEMDPVTHWISKENYIWKWYEEMDPSVKYVLSIDTSDAVGRDDIACVLINSETGATAGAAAFNETFLTTFADWIVEMLIKYPNVVLIIERMYNAGAIIDHLLVTLPKYGIDPFRRIFSRLIQEQADRRDDYQKVSTAMIGTRNHSRLLEQYRQTFGFKTDSESRKLLYNNILMSAAQSIGGRIRDKTLITQMLNLVVRNNRIDHASGDHDDLVMAWLIGHWFLNYCTDLEFYGIDSKRVLIDRESSAKDRDDPQSRYKTALRRKRQERIDVIYEQLSHATSQMDIMRLESELSVLISSVESEGDVDSATTLSAMLSEARALRDSHKRQHHGSNGIHRQARLLRAA